MSRSPGAEAGADGAFVWVCEVDGPVEGELFSATERDPSASGTPRCVALEARGGRLAARGDVDGPFDVLLEDALLHGAHTIHVVGDAAGTACYLDGYVVWSTRRRLDGFAGAADLRDGLARVRVGGPPVGPGAGPGDVAFERRLRDSVPVPRPRVAFVAPELAPSDAAELGEAAEYVLDARFRVRGPGQYGVVLAGSRGGEPVLAASIDAGGVTLARGSDPALRAEGEWSDGRWHRLAVSFVGGAAQVWVDGWLRAHAPGRAPQFDRLTIGQDLRGERLMGEVADGGVHGPLNDQQIARLARREVIPHVPVFGRYPTGAFHRIPVLLRLADGVLLALADARHGLPNDAPNATDLVAARSQDGGRTWSEPAVVLGYPGATEDAGVSGGPAAPVSVTDAALVEDARGRVHLLADLYPAGLGLLRAEPGPGLPAGADVTVEADGTVRAADGTGLGNLHRRGTPATEVGHLAHLVSDDGGRTWGPPRLVTAQVKDEWMPFLGIGPGAGIRLRRGPRAGRLLVPCYFSDADAAQFSAAVLVSDDDGLTWRRGASTNSGRVLRGRALDEQRLGSPEALMSEASVVELEDGAVVMVARSQHPRLLRAVSRDGGETWGEIAQDAMPEIFCQPAATERDGVVHVANAARMLPYRGCGTVYRIDDVPARLAALGRNGGSGGGGGAGARDDGAGGVPSRPLAWRSLAVNPRHHGYQSLAPVEGGVAMLWERETAGVWFSVVPDDLF